MSGKFGTTHRLHRPRQCLLQHRDLFYVCLNRVTNFIFANSALSKPEYALIPDIWPNLAKLASHLVLDGSNYVYSDIHFLDDYIDASTSLSL
jgi:hypothetical protein